jgi:CubicO group peptidase (beta-lactamase class C family)
MIDDIRVASALEQAVAGGEVGLQVAAYFGDTLIVDAWTGLAAAATGRTVDGDTIFPCFSVAKGVTATAVHVQAERGLLDYSDRIADHWPEFGANGKERATVEDALSHRLGMPQMPPGLQPEQLGDWDAIVDALAGQEPLTEPGTANSYHPLTFGWVLGELVRRTDPGRRPFGRFVLDEVAAPIGIDSLFLGVPDSATDRIAVLESDPRAALPPERAAVRARTLPPQLELVPEVYNRRDVQQACIPATGLTTNARSLARMFAMIANGGELDGTRLLSRERVRSFTERRRNYDEIDQTNMRVVPLSSRGYWLEDAVAGSGPGLICSVGAGGAVAWADLETGLSGAICHNRMLGAVARDRHPLTGLGDAIRAVAADHR